MSSSLGRWMDEFSAWVAEIYLLLFTQNHTLFLWAQSHNFYQYKSHGVLDIERKTQETQKKLHCAEDVGGSK